MKLDLLEHVTAARGVRITPANDDRLDSTLAAAATIFCGSWPCRRVLTAVGHRLVFGRFLQ